MLERLRIDLGVAATRTLAVGDGINDLEMLDWAAHGVAMGHAPASVLAAADQICPPGTEGRSCHRIVDMVPIEHLGCARRVVDALDLGHQIVETEHRRWAGRPRPA